jgi:TRAP-type mannitol/chloroaromatic compound transport system permease large subunit
MRRHSNPTGFVALIFGSFFTVAAFAMVCGAAWLTHVIVCLDESKWGFLIAGALFFPIAIVHGIGIWFGVWH